MMDTNLSSLSPTIMPLVIVKPLLTVTQAHQLAAFFSISYVGVLYIFKNARVNFAARPQASVNDGQQRERVDGERGRNDPAVIRARLFLVSLSTALSCLVFFCVVWALAGGSPKVLHKATRSTLERLGLALPGSLRGIVLPLFIAPALFLGPLYVLFLEGSLPFQRAWSMRYSVKPYFCTWAGWRNAIAGPITEEIVFRACVIAAYKMTGASLKHMTFLTPLWFGVAHLHHAWEVYNRYGRTLSALKQAILGAVFQFAYTTLFGFHCAFLFLRTGSLLAPIASHIFCNIMGVPGFGEDVAAHPHRKIPIILTYLLGIAAYIYTIRHWTTVTPDNLYWIA